MSQPFSLAGWSQWDNEQCECIYPRKATQYFKLRSLFFSFLGLSSLIVKVNLGVREVEGVRDKLSVGELRAGPLTEDLPVAIGFLYKLP